MPISSGVKSIGRAMALPTRNVSSEAARRASRLHAIPATRPTAARRNAIREVLIGWPSFLMLLPTPSMRRAGQESLGIELRHIGLGWERAQLDKRSRQHRQGLGIEFSVGREGRHDLVIDFALDFLGDATDPCANPYRHEFV